MREKGSQRYRHPQDDNNGSSASFPAATSRLPASTYPSMSSQQMYNTDLMRGSKRVLRRGIHPSSAPLILLWDEMDNPAPPYH